MLNLITEVSKYLIILLMALYTFNSFRVFAGRSREKQQRIYSSMAGLTYIIHAICYLQLFLVQLKVEIVILYLAQLGMFLAITAFYKTGYRKMSMLIFRNMIMLLMIGFVMLTRLSFSQGVKQFIFASLALIGCLIVPLMIERFRLWSHLGWFYALTGLLLLVMLLFIGSEKYGSTNWIFIGNFGLQPSEFVKIIFIFGMAALLTKYKSFSAIVVITAISAAHVIVLVLEKDLGGALLYFITYLIILFGATAKPAYIIAGISCGTVAAIVAYYMFSHVQTRVLVFLDPLEMYHKGGYQVTQSLFAIGTGGWLGMGLGKGLANGIPVAESDFIFAAIVEEFGGIFSVCLILICLSCFIMFINIAVKLKNMFYKLVALGFGILYIFQVFLNVGGVIKFIPSTGVTLPLVSAGGSSLLSTLLMFSIIQGMYVLYQREAAVSVSEKSEDMDKTRLWNDGKEQKEQRKVRRKLLNDTERSKKVDFAILKLTYLFGILLFSMIGYFGYFLSVKSGTVINNSYNLRQDLLAERFIRGDILSADGKVLATTLINEDGTELRSYPYNKLFSHVVGRFAKGKTGVELSENFTLLTSHINGMTQILNEMSDHKNYGDNVVTSLNYKLQKAAYDALGDQRGSVVVLEPSTGKILAMVSKPDYDPNAVAKNWEELTADTSQSILMNRSVQGLYAPGSTFKIITLLEYIRENPNYKDYRYQCKGKDTFYDVTIHCAGNAVHGEQDLIESFANSCNASFANIGTKLNLNSLNRLCESLMFNQKLPSSLQAVQSSYVLDNRSETEKIPRTVIGLGDTLMTPLHNAMIVACIANSGEVMQPYVVDTVVNHDGGAVRKNSPKSVGQWMSTAEAELLKNYMAAVVTDGTASALSGMPVKVAGKTGTATYDNNKKPHAWFVGFAPVDQPEIVISVLVESVGGGSAYAVPIAKKILQAYYK